MCGFPMGLHKNELTSNPTFPSVCSDGRGAHHQHSAATPKMAASIKGRAGVDIRAIPESLLPPGAQQLGCQRILP